MSKHQYQIQKCDPADEWHLLANLYESEPDILAKVAKYRGHFPGSSFRVMERFDNGEMMMVAFVGDLNAGIGGRDDR